MDVHFTAARVHAVTVIAYGLKEAIKFFRSVFQMTEAEN